VAALAPAEVKALARLLDELDYYQLLEIEPDAPTSRVKQAYYALSRRFHPDANRGLPADLRVTLEAIAKRVAEAYSVLRDARRRGAYDEQLRSASGGRRIHLVEAEARATQQRAQALLGTTPNGKRFFALARGEIDRGNLEAAARNLKMALTFEPGNEYFRQKLEEVQKSARR
jgi:curved DNA-binding protein CbpA